MGSLYVPTGVLSTFNGQSTICLLGPRKTFRPMLLSLFFNFYFSYLLKTSFVEYWSYVVPLSLDTKVSLCKLTSPRKRGLDILVFLIFFLTIFPDNSFCSSIDPVEEKITVTILTLLVY